MTDREQIAQDAREGELFRLLVENVQDYAIFVIDPQGRVESWNPGAERLLGYTEEEIIGKPARVFFTPEDIGNGVPEQEMREALEEGRGNDDRWHVRKDGSRFWCGGTMTPLWDAGRIFRGFAKIMRDRTDWKEAEQARRGSEARQAAILETALDAIITIDHEGRVVEFNPAAEKLFGYAGADVRGRDIGQLVVPPRLREAHRSGMARYLSTGEGPVLGKRIEMPALRADGSEFPVELAITRIPTDGPPLFTAYLRDIGERNRLEESLRASEGRFRGLMEQAPFSIQVFAPDGRAIRVNRAWEELWGVTLEQIGDYNILEDRQLDRKGVLPFIRKGFAGESARVPAIRYDPNETIPDRTRHKEPSRWVAAIIYPLKDTRGVIREVVLVQDDITARKRAEEALLVVHRELEERVADRTAELARTSEFLHALLENVQDGIVACNAEGILTRFNRVTRELHGLPEEPIPAGQWAEHYRLYRPDGRTPMTKDDVPLYRALQGERIRDIEMVIVPEGLPPRTVMTSGQAFFDSGGEKLGAVVSMHDITLRKRAEEALRKAHAELEHRVECRTLELAHANEALRDADRRKDEFLATLAHELRNPLAPIRNALQILKMPRVDAATVERSREMMERQVHHLVRLVDDLLDVSRVMQGKIELRKEPVELAAVVARATETAQPLIEAQGHRLGISIPSESLLLDADPVRLAQVVANLLTNAAKYTEPSGRIWLAAERVGREAVLRIRDNGIGITPAMLPRIFDLFVQVDHATTKAQGGLGIGLTLVKNLCEMHDGSVEARSAGLGKGSEFIVRLPISTKGLPDAGTPEPGLAAGPAAHSGHRLLVVDDNRDAADSLAMLLELQGHEVRVAHSGSAALEMTEAYTPDVVFLDIGMPGMDGYEVARRLRRQPGLEEVVLAALTGWGQQEDRRRTADAGFDHHLVKPPDPKAVESVLAELKKR